MQRTKENTITLINENKTKEKICSIFGVSKSQLYRDMKKWGIQMPNHHNATKFNENIFDVIDTEEKAYWLGLFFADGFVSNRSNAIELSLKGDDIEHLKKFNLFMGHKAFEVKHSLSKCNGKEYSRCRWYVVNKHIHSRLIKIGCTPQKSLTLKFPNIEIFSNKNLIKDFMRGYFDGDGSISFTPSGRACIQLYGTREFLTEYIKYLPQTFNIQCRSKEGKNIYVLRTSYKKGDEVANFLYQNANIYLERKYKIYELAVLRRNL